MSRSGGNARLRPVLPPYHELSAGIGAAEFWRTRGSAKPKLVLIRQVNRPRQNEERILSIFHIRILNEEHSGRTFLAVLDR